MSSEIKPTAVRFQPPQRARIAEVAEAAGISFHAAVIKLVDLGLGSPSPSQPRRPRKPKVREEAVTAEVQEPACLPPEEPKAAAKKAEKPAAKPSLKDWLGA